MQTAACKRNSTAGTCSVLLQSMSHQPPAGTRLERYTQCLSGGAADMQRIVATRKFLV